MYAWRGREGEREGWGGGGDITHIFMFKRLETFQLQTLKEVESLLKHCNRGICYNNYQQEKNHPKKPSRSFFISTLFRGKPKFHSIKLLKRLMTNQK